MSPVNVFFHVFRNTQFKVSQVLATDLQHMVIAVFHTSTQSKWWHTGCHQPSPHTDSHAISFLSIIHVSGANDHPHGECRNVLL